MNAIYSLNWSLGLNNLIWREIRSKIKAKFKIGLDENLGFESNLVKNRSQHLFTMEIRSRLKAQSKIGLDENLSFQSNLMENRS